MDRVATSRSPERRKRSGVPFTFITASNRYLENGNGLIGKKPLLGYAMDTSRAFYGENKKVLYTFPGNGTDAGWQNRFEPIPLHPHNGVVQVWLASLFLTGSFVVAGRSAPTP